MAQYPFQKILVPVDLSGHNKVALDFSAKIAAHSKTTLHLVHVLEHYVGFDLFYDNKTKKHFMEEMGKKAYQMLQKAHPSIRSEKIKTETAILRGNAVDEICKYARKHKIDLIVLEPHGTTSGFLQKALFGSTHEKIIHKAGCPVLTVIK